MKHKVKNVKKFEHVLDKKICNAYELEEWFNNQQDVWEIATKVDEEGFFEPTEEEVEELYQIYIQYKTVKNIFNLSVQVLGSEDEQGLTLDDENYRNVVKLLEGMIFATKNTQKELKKEKAQRLKDEVLTLMEELSGGKECQCENCVARRERMKGYKND